MGSEQFPVREIKGVLHVSCGVRGRDVEGFEIMEVVLDLGAEGYGKSQARKNFHHILCKLRHGMDPPPLPAPGRKSYINAVPSFFLCRLRLLERRPFLCKPGFHFVTKRIHRLTGGGPLFRRKRSKFFQKGRQDSFFSEKAHLHLLQFFGCCRPGKLSGEVLLYCLKFAGD